MTHYIDVAVEYNCILANLLTQYIQAAIAAKRAEQSK
jgi:hypothetical protein